MSSYPKSGVRLRNSDTPNKSGPTGNSTASIEKTSRRLFENDGEEEQNGSTKKIIANIRSFDNYREQSHEDSFNDSINGPFNVNNFSFNENQYNSPGFKERNLKLADVDKGLEVIGRGLAKDQRVSWREHWSFLDEFIDIGSNEGLAMFEKYLEDRLKERMKPPASIVSRKIQLKPLPLTPLPVTPVSKISQRLFQIHIEKSPSDENFTNMRASTPSSPNAFHAYMCVEKSCQIYANHLLKPIAQNPNNIATVNDVLVGELNRLKSLICSYKQDLRFFAVDFQATHARFAHIVVALLSNDAESQAHNVKDTLQNTLTRILQSKEKLMLNTSKNGTKQDEHAKNTAQSICLLTHLLKRLHDSSNVIPPEVLTTENDCVDIWNGEEKCDCEWTNTNNAKTHRSIKRKNRLSDTFNDFCDKLNLKNGDTDEEDLGEAFWVRSICHCVCPFNGHHIRVGHYDDHNDRS